MTQQPTPPYVKGSETSQEAAESMKQHAPTLRHRVYFYILERGAHGATDSEVEAALDLKHQTASARRRELEIMGAVYRSNIKRLTSSGRRAGVYVAIEGVDINKKPGPKTPAVKRRSKRVTICLTADEYAAIQSIALEHRIDPGAMARALMIHGYRFKTGLQSAEVML